MRTGVVVTETDTNGRQVYTVLCLKNIRQLLPEISNDDLDGILYHVMDQKEVYVCDSVKATVRKANSFDVVHAYDFQKESQFRSYLYLTEQTRGFHTAETEPQKLRQYWTPWQSYGPRPANYRTYSELKQMHPDWSITEIGA